MLGSFQLHDRFRHYNRRGLDSLVTRLRRNNLDKAEITPKYLLCKKMVYDARSE